MKDSEFPIHVHNITDIGQYYKEYRRKSCGVYIDMGEDIIFIEANPNNAKFLRDAANEIDAVLATRGKE
jgi:hypothetical protein